MTIIIHVHVPHNIIIIILIQLHAKPKWYTIPGNNILSLLLFRFGALRTGWKENGYKKK